ncbi:hypothetical protein A2U01_0093305, partial [Trifolium medium]|nr:hypothetical protein [Trifolium medium]
MVASMYDQYYRMDCGLPHYSPPLMAAVQDCRARTPTPSYYQQYPQQTDLTGLFQRQTTRLMEHQNHVQDIWSR